LDLFLVADDEESPLNPVGGGSRSLFVIDHSESIDHAEADLRWVLFIAIGGSRSAVAPHQVLDVVAWNFNIDVSSMRIMSAAPEDFLLALPDTGVADWVFNRGLHLHGPKCTLFFKRWTRLSLVDAAALPVEIDVELCSIPAHAWDLATTQELLSVSCWCWVCSMHPDTTMQWDLSAFRVSAWCTRPEPIPAIIDLNTEPAPAEAEMPPMKWGLIYPIERALLNWANERGSPTSLSVLPALSREPVHSRHVSASAREATASGDPASKPALQEIRPSSHGKAEGEA
jgi:hypothetical protein